MSLESAIVIAAINGDNLLPQITTSSNYKHWVSVEDSMRCIECANNHGKIWLNSDTPNPEPPTHPNCRCLIKLMQAIAAGTATIHGINGADWTLMFKKCLPDYYISKEDALVRIWYKADINYQVGKRNTQRVLWSTDGLIFVTYDHYETFYEII